MGFFAGTGRGLRAVLDGAAGTQALIAGDYRAYGRMRRSRRVSDVQAEGEEARRLGPPKSWAAGCRSRPDRDGPGQSGICPEIPARPDYAQFIR